MVHHDVAAAEHGRGVDPAAGHQGAHAGQVAVVRERFCGAEQRFHVVVELCVLNLFQLGPDVFIVAEDIGAVHQNGFGTEEIFLVRAALRIA